MGHTIYVRSQTGHKTERGVEPTYQALRLHPNFEFPDTPPLGSRAAVIDFVLESVARFVSPPKVDGEDEEFACEDIADAIRTKLKPEIFARLSIYGTMGTGIAVDMEQVSLDWERQTGFDSIPTIRRVYDQTPSGAYKCVWPGCSMARRDPLAMWRHVHTAHGKNSLPPEVR